MIYMVIVRNYLDYINSNLEEDDEIRNNRYLLEELLRSSICYGLGLPSTSATERIILLEREVSKEILGDMDISNWSVEFKQGVLEACMKVIEMAYDKVDGGDKVVELSE